MQLEKIGENEQVPVCDGDFGMNILDCKSQVYDFAYLSSFLVTAPNLGKSRGTLA